MEIVEYKIKKYFKYVRLVLLILVILVFPWLLCKNFAPTGKLVLNHKFSSGSPFFSPVRNFDVAERGINSKISYSRVTASPAEFTLNMPRKFEQVGVELKYLSDYPLLLLSSKKKNSRHHVSKILSMSLSGENWQRIEDKEKGLVLLQQYRQSDEEKENKVEPKPQFDYEKVDDFLNDVENIVDQKEKKIAYFNHDLSDRVKIPDYQPLTESITFDKTIRGKHQIETYVGNNEDLDFHFYFQDMNKKDGSDRFNVLIDRGSNTIARYTVEDDGDTSPSHKSTAVRDLHIQRSNLQPGKYTIILDISDDLFVQKIETKQKNFAFVKSLLLSDPEQSSTLYTDTSKLTLQTVHAEGQQTVNTQRQTSYDSLLLEGRELTELGPPDKEIAIAESKQKYNLPLKSINQIEVAKNYLILEFKGLIGPDAEAVYNLVNLERYVYPLQIDTNLDQTDFIITDYFEPSRQEKTLQVVKQTFTLEELEVEEGEVKFSLHIPGYNRNKSDLKLAEIGFTLEKDPWDLEFFIGKAKNILK